MRKDSGLKLIMGMSVGYGLALTIMRGMAVSAHLVLLPDVLTVLRMKKLLGLYQ